VLILVTTTCIRPEDTDSGNRLGSLFTTSQAGFAPKEVIIYEGMAIFSQEETLFVIR